MFRRSIFVPLGLITVVLAVGCRGQGQAPAEPVEAKPEGPGEASEDDGVNIGEGGPKIMGYQYFVRMSYGLLSGKYSDEQTNETVSRDSEVPETAMRGKRIVLEHYPMVYENFPRSQYGYALIDYRDESTDAGWWEKHQTMVLLMGYILPRWRLLAPVVGLHWEFNKIDMGLAESPEVSKSDLRAVVLGADFRQKLWGTGTWFAAFYSGKLHLLNPTLDSNGWEAEVGLGATFQVSLLRSDATLGYIEQRYKGSRKAEADDDRLLKVTSRYHSTYLQLTLWI